MTKYVVAPATVEHALELAPVMRKEDTREVWAGAHYTPEVALLTSMAGSPEPVSWLADDRVLYMCGVGEFPGMKDQGVPWGLGARELPKHSRPFLRFSRNFILDVAPRYRQLLNFVDARHTVAIRWLGWLGFKLWPVQPLGPENLSFHMFTMDRT